MTESSNSTSQPKKHRWLVLLRPKVAIPLVLVVLLLLSPVLIRGWNLSQIPDLGDPYAEREAPELEESDNAWVNYQRAEELRFVRKQTVAFEHITFAPGYEPDWTPRSREAITLWKSDKKREDNESYFQLESNLNALEDAVDRNREALNCWKEGTSKDRFEEMNPLPVLKPVDDYIYNPYQFHLDQLAMARAGQLASQGKQAEALEWMLAVYRYSRHLTQSGGTNNWERAVEISQSVFDALDELLDDEGFTHDELIAFLHELEESYELTGTLERAQLDDYFTLKQRLTDAYLKGETYREELAYTVERAGIMYVAPESQSNFELFLEGEPQLSIRVLQHHFESLRRNLDKPVPDRATDAGPPWGSNADGVTLSADRWEEFLSKAGLLELAVGQRGLFTNPFLAEDDAAIFEGLRILIAAHAFSRKSPSDRSPGITMEALAADSLGETPRDPYNPALSLILAAGKDGEMGVFTSHSNKYEHLADGGSLETIPVEYLVPTGIIPGYSPPDEPQVDELMFRLPAEEP